MAWQNCDLRITLLLMFPFKQGLSSGIDWLCQIDTQRTHHFTAQNHALMQACAQLGRHEKIKENNVSFQYTSRISLIGSWKKVMKRCPKGKALGIMINWEQEMGTLLGSTPAKIVEAMRHCT